VPNQQHIEEVQNSDFAGARSGCGAPARFTHARRISSTSCAITTSTPDLQAEGKVGLNFPMMQGEFDGQLHDLMALYNQSAAGFDLEAQRKTVGELAYLFNQMLPIIPIVEEICANPINEDKVTGIPRPTTRSGRTPRLITSSSGACLTGQLGRRSSAVKTMARRGLVAACSFHVPNVCCHRLCTAGCTTDFR
jgi:hypothetical protein